MELDDLKSGWQAAGDASKTEADILKMTRITNHPSLQRIRTKLMMEAILLTFFLVVYYDWFDGDKKPLYANVLLVSSLLAYILNDVIGYVSLRKPIRGSNLKLSIENYLAGIKRLSVLSITASILYSVCFIIFFTSLINFNKEKYFILLGIIILLVQAMFWSIRIWTRWIKSLKQQVRDMEIGVQ
jgi:hypothetical protein